MTPFEEHLAREAQIRQLQQQQNAWAQSLGGAGLGLAAMLSGQQNVPHPFHHGMMAQQNAAAFAQQGRPPARPGRTRIPRCKPVILLPAPVRAQPDVGIPADCFESFDAWHADGRRFTCADYAKIGKASERRIFELLNGG